MARRWDAKWCSYFLTSPYEEARDRHRIVPPLARGAGVRLSEAEAQALIDGAIEEAKKRQAASAKRWGWLELPRWDYDDAARTLTFSGPGKPAVVADVRLAGSYATKSGTFQWSWALYGADDPAIGGIGYLRGFGEVRGIPLLTTPWWECPEEEAWAMAALAGYLVGCEGLYRAPFDDLYWFMLLDGWRSPSQRGHRGGTRPQASSAVRGRRRGRKR